MTNQSMDRSALKESIASIMGDVYRSQTGAELSPLHYDTVLLETGLDSLGFAIVVTRIEEELGYDPFSLATEPFYPTRFGELVDFYFENVPT